jgi:thiol:disulfide interchange protein DsbD
MKNLFFVLSILLSAFGFAQTPLNPVVWTATYSELSSTEGEIIFTATIEKKWHIYSQRPTTDGPIPTSFSVTPNANFNIVGKVEENNAHEEYVAAFDAKVFVFDGVATFKQKIKRKNSQEFKVNTSLEFMTCNDVQCLPPKTLDFSVSIPASKK